MSGPPFGACVPRRNSFARPAVGTRSRTLNEAALCVVIVTDEDEPLGIESSRYTRLFASAAAGTSRATRAAAAKIRTRRMVGLAAGSARDDRDAIADGHHVDRRAVVATDRGLGEHIGRRSVRDDATTVEEQHAVGVLGGEGQV